MSPRTGRPKSDNPKSTTFKIRFDEKDVDKLDYLSKKLDVSKSEVIRIGIDKVYKENK